MITPGDCATRHMQETSARMTTSTITAVDSQASNAGPGHSLSTQPQAHGRRRLSITNVPHAVTAAVHHVSHVPTAALTAAAHSHEDVHNNIQFHEDIENVKLYAKGFKWFTIATAVFNVSAVSICFAIAIYAWPQTDSPAQRTFAISEGLHTTVRDDSRHPGTP